MKIVEVSPLTRGRVPETLDYFTSKEITTGAIVSVMVRGREVPAIVTKATEASELKSDLRAADYSLKKIKSVLHDRLFSNEFIRAAMQTSDYFAAPLGPVVKTFVAEELLIEKRLLHQPLRQPAPGILIEKTALQDTDQERLIFYKSLIREEFAKNASVFLCLPNLTAIEKFVPELEKGIGRYLIVLHRQLTKKELRQRLKKLSENTHPLLIVATPLFLALAKTNLRTIILDHENSAGWKTITPPLIDIRTFAEFLAQQLGARLIVGDVVLRIETMYRLKKGDYLPASTLKHRITNSATPILLEPNSAEPGKALTPKLLNILSTALEQGENCFIWHHRRGLAPLVLCQDCGTTVTCHDCQTPMVLHRQITDGKITTDNAFVCHFCGASRSSAEHCRHCGGWRLYQWGIGIESIAEEIKNAFPKINLVIATSDTIKTKHQLEAAFAHFYRARGSIMLGTELALAHLKDKIPQVICLGPDTLLTLPDFRIEEKIFSHLVRLRLLASKQFVIQARKSTRQKLFTETIRGDLLAFYRHEVSQRRNFNYPPFSILIKITLRGERRDVLLQAKQLNHRLAEYDPDVYPAFRPLVHGKYHVHLLIRLSQQRWPDKKLLEILKTLSPSYTINVDPANLL